MQIEFRLLGQVEAWHDGRRLELGGRKQRAVLAALLVRAGRVVSLEQLIDDLWPDDPPARAAATVQVFVSNLRRALEPERPRGTPASLLVTSSPGYVLRAGPGAIDAHEFVRLAEQGRAALEDDDGELAAELLTRAGALWRGPALVDVLDAPFAQAEAARLEEMRLSCAEDRIDAELSLGRHNAVVPELEQRVSRHPMRERPRAQLMLALYRSGRQADALETYRTGRRVLHDELGLEPGASLRALELAVLRQDPDLAWEPPERVIRDGGTAGGTAGGSAAAGDGEPGRVLVVDDSGVNRRLLVRALTELGHEVRAAEHGRRALEMLREGEDLRDAGDAGAGFDVVLLDLLMPVLDGYSTLAEIKADERLNHLPVIMVSAVHELESVVRCIDLGATDYLPKPFSAAVLRARLRSSLAAKRLRDVERAYLRRVDEVVSSEPGGLAEQAAQETARDDVVGRLARRLLQMTRDVSAREAALREEIAALRTEIDRVHAMTGREETGQPVRCGPEGPG
ncbi:MAG TPA: BTAD domain-containing putative transcriptional regulator [Pseudonocardia sp.]|nr:BTAD domain-containing putative transcriptional regulator [Pseudonocardia sp.]